MLGSKSSRVGCEWGGCVGSLQTHKEMEMIAINIGGHVLERNNGKNKRYYVFFLKICINVFKFMFVYRGYK